MYFRLKFFLLALSFFGQSLSTPPPEPISLHAPLLDQAEESSLSGSSHPGNNLPPLKISTGRMKPISSTGSPRYQEAMINAGIGTGKQIKSTSHVGILPHLSSEHLYPKVTVKPGRKDSTVVSYFTHARANTVTSKPYEYMQDQRKDLHADISQPARFYKIGQHKVVEGSKDIDHISGLMKSSGNSQYNPKAALISTVQGDSRAKQKRPTIEVDPGKYYGNFIASVYAPKSPPKRGGVIISPLQQTSRPSASGGAVPINNPARSRSRSRSTSPNGGAEGKRRRVS